jgi:hypothetical protein
VTYDIFKDEQDLSNVVLSFACEMENNGDYLLASYIYVHWGKPLKALTIINEQLRKEIEKAPNTECSFNFNEYVDLGRNVSFNLRTNENNYTPNPSYDTIDIENKKKEIRLEIKFFYLLIKCYDAILQGESLEQALEREVFEEVGVKVRNIKYFDSQPWPFPASLMLGFFAEATSEKRNIDYNEIEDANWFSIEELKTLQHPSINGEFKLPRVDSIARRLVDNWINKFN